MMGLLPSVIGRNVADFFLSGGELVTLILTFF